MGCSSANGSQVLIARTAASLICDRNISKLTAPPCEKPAMSVLLLAMPCDSSALIKPSMKLEAHNCLLEVQQRLQ